MMQWFIEESFSYIILNDATRIFSIGLVKELKEFYLTRLTLPPLLSIK